MGYLFPEWADKASDFLGCRVFPIGLFLLLTGMFWIGKHGLYPKVFYWAVLLPATLSIVSSPSRLRQLASSPIFLVCLVFFCYAMASSLWSESEKKNTADLVKLPFFIMLLFYFVFELGRRRFDLLVAVMKWAAVFAVAAGIYMLGVFFRSGGGDRFAGYGALYNPLLVSHVFGFYLAWWLGVYFSRRPLFEPLILVPILVLVALLLATGSRTPLVAMTVTIFWLAAIVWSRKGALAIAALLIAVAAIFLLSPEMLTQRGSSYRTEIWGGALQQIGEAPWFGHGFDTPIRIWVEGIPYPLWDPHNLTLSVLFEGGVSGGLLWLALYLAVLRESWHWRSNPWVMACSATVIYGLMAGMTEGGGVFSRPNEHWFLIWIPLVLVAAVIQQAKTMAGTSQETMGANG
ncbi:O-antigen ligase family protein [Azonexus sp.]|jgi:O-antigen ligase|uniref:O-antigen ligase family protein n=1 Tax=Azonexus sp. TaxID=1872668 RepID=UPI002833D769|nr:O-antigen ligase family protein [Azonexus sp.]MDR1996646.1 O-antigen ligase family protein [Azonexus sp.]